MRARAALPTELERSVPREVGLTTGGRVLMLTAWLLAGGALAAGAALYLEAQRQWGAAADIDRRGVATAAIVDRVWRKTGDGKPAFAAFHFDANGARIGGEARMQLSAWRELRAGGTVPVRFLPDNPRVFVVDGQRRGRLPFAVAYVVSSVLAALALLCAALVRRQRTLLSEGRTARAVVTALTKTQGAYGEVHRAMTYTFALLGGGTVTGKAGASKDTQIGASFYVLYDPEHPARNRPYPFSLVTLDRER